MQVLSLPACVPCAPPRASCVALGFFDGVHRGHIAVLSEAAARAKAMGLPLLVYTFRAEDAPKADAPLLSTDAERAALFYALGASLCVFEDFSSARTTPPDRFVNEVLLETLGTRCAVVGEDFRFGHRAAGDAALLNRLLSENGASAIALPPVLHGGAPISSSRIRAALALGDACEAAVLLGRPYALTLPVCHGKALGRTMGLPTANQELPDGRAIPADGVYATECVLPDGRTLRGVTDIGLRPTVAGKERRMETHILDFSGDLYGAPLTVCFLARLRGEVTFPTLSALIEQIKNDVKEARAWKAQNGSN